MQAMRCALDATRASRLFELVSAGLTDAGVRPIEAGMEQNTPEARWSAVLDELWHHVSRALDSGAPLDAGAALDPDAAPDPAAALNAGAALDAGAALAAWVPPAGLGPIPLSLRARAESIQRAQQLAIAQVRVRKDEVASRMKAVRKIPQLFPTDASVYVDRLG